MAPRRGPVSDASLSGDGTACGLDLVLGRGRELLRRDVHLDGDVASAEHLDGLALADGTLLHERRDVDVAALGRSSGGRLRQPSFQRVRTDLTATDLLETGDG